MFSGFFSEDALSTTHMHASQMHGLPEAASSMIHKRVRRDLTQITDSADRQIVPQMWSPYSQRSVPFCLHPSIWNDLQTSAQGSQYMSWLIW